MHHSTIQYPLRPCKHCGDLIPNTKRDGTRLTRARYQMRKCCRKGECFTATRYSANKPHPMPVLDQPIDLFIYIKPA